MKLIVLDTETSDLDPSKGAAILEIAWLELQQIESRWQPAKQFEAYLQHSGQLSPHAQAINHIRADQLTAESGARPREQVVARLLNDIDKETYLVAHNAEFDSKFLSEINVPWICTFRSAKHIWPEAPGHSNQVLRYWLNVHPMEAYTMGRFPHQAMYDVATTTAILQKMLEKYTVDQLFKLSSQPVRLKTMPFGKHRGVPFEQVPTDYLQWLNSKSDLDADMKYTIRATLHGQ